MMNVLRVMNFAPQASVAVQKSAKVGRTRIRTSEFGTLVEWI